MSSLMETLAFILPIIATLCVVTVISLNIFLKIRKKFCIKVNCWFCNEWTKVLYDDVNSFYCPKCSQYNGFDKDGGYNKVLPEQHDQLLNKQAPLIKKKVVFMATNGLCESCNTNQRLKIHQLANFVPLNEDCFDMEVDHYQKQLDKSYELCDKCKGTLKNVISTQRITLFARNVQKNGLSLLDLSKSSGTISKQTKHRYLLYLLNFTLILSPALILFYSFCNVALALPLEPVEYINKHLPNYVVPHSYPVVLNKTQFQLKDILKEYVDIMNNKYFTIIDFHNNNTIINAGNPASFPKYVEKLDISLKTLNLNGSDINRLCYIGLLFQLIAIFFNNNTIYKNAIQIILWSCLYMGTWYQHAEGLETIIYILQVLTSASILYTFLVNGKPQKLRKIKNQYRRSPTYDLTCSDDSGNEDAYKKDISPIRRCSAFHSLPKSAIYTNGSDTPDTNYSFESIKSQHAFVQSSVNEPQRQMDSPRDKLFGFRPIFTNILNPSPISFKEFSSRSYSPSYSGASPFRDAGISTTNYSFESIKSQHVFVQNSVNESQRQMDSPRAQLFVQPLFTNVLNPSPISFNEFNRFNSTPYSGASPFRNAGTSTTTMCDLNKSLDNLHLCGNNLTKKVPITVLKNNIRRPIVSPTKFTPFNHVGMSNGNVWSNYKDTSSYRVPIISRSLSESSGFASQANENSNSRYNSSFKLKNSNSFSGGACNSLLSEPSHVQKFYNCRDNTRVSSSNIWKKPMNQSHSLTEDLYTFRPSTNERLSNIWKKPMNKNGPIIEDPYTVRPSTNERLSNIWKKPMNQNHPRKEDLYSFRPIQNSTSEELLKNNLCKTHNDERL